MLLFWWPPAGTLTLVLAVLAAVTALPKVSKKMEDNLFLHALAIFVFCSIAAAEFAVIDHADKVSEDHYEYLVSRFDNTDRIVTANMAAQQRVMTLAEHPTKLGARFSGSPPQTLKSKAIHLSADILSFLTQRQAGEPPLPRRETWEQDVQTEVKYMQQTMALYSQNFGARVIATREELAQKGITDKELDDYYENPTNPIGIRIVAERLGSLAERLPN